MPRGGGKAVLRRTVVAAVAAALVAMPGVAHAHGDQQKTSPADGSHNTRVPKTISVTLTEPPGPGSHVRAFDGCHDRVPGEISTSGNELVLALDGGQPGGWMVTWHAISSVDGHPTRGRFHFHVAGKRDCSTEVAENGDQIAGGESTRVSAPPQEDDGGGFPVVPFAAGTVVVVGLAIFLRRAAGSN